MFKRLSSFFGLQREDVAAAETLRTPSRETQRQPAPPLSTDRRIPRPKVKGRTPEERIADNQKFEQALMQQSKLRTERTRAQAMSAGSKSYIWRTGRDGDVCKFCKANEGRRFSWDIVEGRVLPGTFMCTCDSHCRCYPEPTFPRD